MSRYALIGLSALALLAPAGDAAAAGGSAQPRVVGGFPVSATEYPWQAAVVRTTGGGSAFNRQFCGGSLITSRIVLTAGHCVEDTDPDCGPIPPCSLATELPLGVGDGTDRIDPDDVKVILGQTTLSTAPPASELAVVDVAFQGDAGEMPAYDRDTLQNDIGYLVLNAASAQGQIKLAASAESDLWQPDVFADITGWGSVSFGGPRSDSLLAGSVPVVTDSSCTASYGSEFAQGSMVCAGYAQGGVDTCQGDSGGPLESPLLGGGYRLIGITSWGVGCAEAGFPGVYTRVFEMTLRDAIVAKVAALESDNGIVPSEDPVGNGLALPRGGGPTFPPPAQPGVTVPPPATSTAVATDPFAKCRRVRAKKKRKKCTKRVRATLNS